MIFFIQIKEPPVQQEIQLQALRHQQNPQRQQVEAKQPQVKARQPEAETKQQLQEIWSCGRNNCYDVDWLTYS